MVSIYCEPKHPQGQCSQHEGELHRVDCTLQLEGSPTLMTTEALKAAKTMKQERKKENYFLKVQIPSVQPQESLNLAAYSPDCHPACH